jgi:hypothetical protein
LSFKVDGVVFPKIIYPNSETCVAILYCKRDFVVN